MTKHSRPAAMIVTGILLGGPLFAGCALEHEKQAIDHTAVQQEPEVTVIDDSGLKPPAYEWSNSPSPLVLRLPEGDVTLHAWTTCWSGPPDKDGVVGSMCADGRPGLDSELDQVGPVASVDFWFGRPGWTFEARFGEDASGVVTRTGDQEFTITPPADLTPGDHRVDVSGNGPEGDYVTSFVWTV